GRRAAGSFRQSPLDNLRRTVPMGAETIMALNVAVQMDPIERINVRGDSTLALLLEAQARGHRLHYYTPDRLAMNAEGVFATLQSLAVRDQVGDHFTL